MKSILISFIEDVEFGESSTAYLSQLPSHRIQEVSWKEYPYLPHVEFKIAHSKEAILLEYKVAEKDVVVHYKNSNDPVYKDSCVEFFISFDQKHYYNFEFNSIGAALVAYGSSYRKNRSNLSEELINKIKVFSKIGKRNTDGDTEWTLQLKIPFELFLNNSIESLKGTKAWANFYKCGDDLPVPHFVSWRRINSLEPNFHLPEYFGEIEFL